MVEQRSPKPLARVRFLVPPPSLKFRRASPQDYNHKIIMENFKPKENKYDITKFNEQKAKEEREKIKELNEKFKKAVKDIEEANKGSDVLPT